MKRYPPSGLVWLLVCLALSSCATPARVGNPNDLPPPGIATLERYIQHQQAQITYSILSMEKASQPHYDTAHAARAESPTDEAWCVVIDTRGDLADTVSRHMIVRQRDQIWSVDPATSSNSFQRAGCSNWVVLGPF